LWQAGKVMLQAAKILRSSGMQELRAAAAEGVSATASIAGRVVTYDPAPISGMTNFAENTFHLGANAFKSEAELAKTVLHELYRLAAGAGGSATGAAATAQTSAAAGFAEKAYRAGHALGIW
jgi:hypothetical protein